jgi:hypothetical protein
LAAQRPFADCQEALEKVREVPRGAAAEQIGRAEGGLVAEKPFVNDDISP